MRNTKLLATLIFAIAIISFACEKEESIPANPNGGEKSNSNQQRKKSAVTQQHEGLVVLGDKLEDPYAIKNMKKAYANMKSANPSLPDVDIKPTHLYLRFLPKTEEDWDLLKSDTTLVLYDFPLDYEMINLGTYYQDPSLPDNSITWQYCVVPVDHSIPNVYYEPLYEVYIPDEDIAYTKGSAELVQLLDNLEIESAMLTGNLTKGEIDSCLTKGLLPSKWTPKGTIKVWDDVIGSTTTYTQVFDHWETYDCNSTDPAQLTAQRLVIQEPVEQCTRAVYRTVASTTQGSYIPLTCASVHARWFTRVKTDLTDGNGYFQTAKFRFRVNYAIKWERSHYDIRDGMVWQAWYNGPKKKGDWNLNIGKGGKSIMYATIHCAAFKQFYGVNMGILRPTSVTKTKICYIDQRGNGVFWGDWGEGFLPDIKIWGKNPSTGIYKSTDEIFGTTTHEVGHLSHWNYIGIINYAQTSEKIYESWAEAIEWALTNDEYHRMGAKYGGTLAINYDCPYTNQHKWPNVSDKTYSPIFIDLMDTFNQRVGGWIGNTFYYGCYSCPNDKISGYSISYIQNHILNEAYGLSSLRDAIKNHKITGVTNTAIDELFVLYW